jgi:hypothetical protein
MAHETCFEITFRRSDAGLIYARCADIPELMIAKPTVEALNAVLPCIVAELLDLRGTPAQVRRADDDGAKGCTLVATFEAAETAA